MSERKIVYPTEGICPFCKRVLTLSDEERRGETNVICPVCKAEYDIRTIDFSSLPDNINTLDAKKRNDINVRVSNNNTINNQGLTHEFTDKLSTFKIYVILSLLFDVMFIFTILGLLQRGTLNKYDKKVISEHALSSFKNWDIAFIVILVLKIIGLCGFGWTYTFNN